MTKVTFELPLSDSDKQFISEHLLGAKVVSMPGPTANGSAPAAPAAPATAEPEPVKNKGGRPRKNPEEPKLETPATIAQDDPFNLSDAAKGAMVTDDDPFAENAASAIKYDFAEMKTLGMKKLDSNKEGLRKLFGEFKIGKFSDLENKPEEIQKFGDALAKL